MLLLQVLYNDGEEEWLHLRNERVIWRLAPSDDSSEEEDEDEDDIDDEFDLHVSSKGSHLVSEGT